MPGVTHGRIILGTALVGWGVIGLLFGEFVNSLQPFPAWLPGYRALAILNALGLLGAGLALVAGVRVRRVALAVAAWLVIWIPLLHIPQAIADPVLLRSPFWIRTFELLALAGGCLVLAGRPEIGRRLFGIALPVFGILHFVYPVSVAVLIPPWYPWPLFWAWFTGAAHFAAGVAIATGIQARLAALLAGTMYGLWALTLHLPRQFMEEVFHYSGPRPEWTSTCVAVAFCGAAWIVAGSLASRRPARTPVGTVPEPAREGGA
ncbi:MAG TPA: hypothetical protein VKZ85_15845 [Woeseiaceae bacterium]|nr:hypothetical protein [Woeseiaceae bacterium]